MKVLKTNTITNKSKLCKLGSLTQENENEIEETKHEEIKDRMKKCRTLKEHFQEDENQTLKKKESAVQEIAILSHENTFLENFLKAKMIEELGSVPSPFVKKKKTETVARSQTFMKKGANKKTENNPHDNLKRRKSEYRIKERKDNYLNSPNLVKKKSVKKGDFVLDNENPNNNQNSKKKMSKERRKSELKNHMRMATGHMDIAKKNTIERKFHRDESPVRSSDKKVTHELKKNSYFSFLNLLEKTGDLGKIDYNPDVLERKKSRKSINKEDIFQRSKHKKGSRESSVHTRSPVLKYSELINQEKEDDIDRILAQKTYRTKTKRFQDIEAKRHLRRMREKVIDSIEDEEEFEELAVNHSEFVIHPDSYFKMVFDFIIIVITLYSTILGPWAMAFGDTNIKIFKYLEIVFDIVFIIDIFINFFVPYHNNDEVLILNNSMIISNYVFGWLILDLFSSVPANIIVFFYELSGNDQGSLSHFTKFTAMYRVLKIMKIFKLIKIVDFEKIKKLQVLEEFNLSSTKERLLRFAFSFLLISHLLTCIWIYLAHLDESSNWIIKSELINSENLDIYIASLYFQWTTIFTIGYGDILSVSMYERIFNILIMLIGVMIYSFTVSSLGHIVSTYDKITETYLRNVDILEEIRGKYPDIDEPEKIKKKVVDEKGLEHEEVIVKNESLYDKLCKYLRHQHKSNKQEKLNFIRELPMKMKNDLLFAMYKDFVYNFSFFKSYDGENKAFNCKIILIMRPLKAYKEEYIYKENETIEEMFFVKSGVLSVELDSRYNNTQLFVLRKNDYFGVVNVLNNERSEINIKVKSKTAELFIINKQDLFQVSTEFPKIFSEIFKTSSLNYSKMKELMEDKKIKYENEKSFYTGKNQTELDINIMPKTLLDMSTIKNSNSQIMSSPKKETKDRKSYMFTRMFDRKESLTIVEEMNSKENSKFTDSEQEEKKEETDADVNPTLSPVITPISKDNLVNFNNMVLERKNRNTQSYKRERVLNIGTGNSGGNKQQVATSSFQGEFVDSLSQQQSVKSSKNIYNLNVIFQNNNFINTKDDNNNNFNIISNTNLVKQTSNSIDQGKNLNNLNNVQQSPKKKESMGSQKKVNLNSVQQSPKKKESMGSQKKAPDDIFFDSLNSPIRTDRKSRFEKKRSNFFTALNSDENNERSEEDKTPNSHKDAIYSNSNFDGKTIDVNEEIIPNFFNSNQNFLGKHYESETELKKNNSFFSSKFSRSSSRSLAMNKSKKLSSNLILRKKSLFLTQKVKHGTLVLDDNLKKSNSFNMKNTNKSTMMLREKTIREKSIPIKRDILIIPRNRNQPLMTNDITKNSKAIISELSSNVKNNLKQSMDLQRNPKKFILKEVKNIFQKHIENEKKEFNDMFDKLDGIYDSIAKQLIEKNFKA